MNPRDQSHAVLPTATMPVLLLWLASDNDGVRNNVLQFDS
jgi:hypothetical protein